MKLISVVFTAHSANTTQICFQQNRKDGLTGLTVKVGQIINSLYCLKDDEPFPSSTPKYANT